MSFSKINSSDFCYVKASTFTYSDTACANYPLNIDCDLFTNINDKTTCELCKNNKLAGKYSQINKGNSKNLLDTKDQYQRSWYQMENLGVGILFLLFCIYYQI
jgi:hypothetical protein